MLLCLRNLTLVLHVDQPSTQNVLMKTSLTPLALGPQPGKLLLQDVEVRDLLLIDLGLLGFTVLTHSYTYNHNQHCIK